MVMITMDARVDNAERRARDERVRPIRLGPGQYIVASSSLPGHGYVVRVDSDDTVACTCPAAQWDFPCKHAVAVRQLEQEQRPAERGAA